ncbi:N-acetylneuraminate synthase family protein [Chloroflexota bacterium]
MNKLKSVEPLFVFDIANNHMGNTEHGIRIIREVFEVTRNFNYNFGFKLQYRQLDTFIHPDYQGSMDFKYVKRFSETRLTPDDMKKLKDEMERLGFITVCTPFDEASVDLVEEHGFDIIKVASCSFTDWPLWERIILTDKPIIASTAGASLGDIDKVVAFLEHRQKEFALMHCVAEYPTPNAHLQLDQIELLKKRFPQISIGYSTHENPDNVEPIEIAIGEGSTIFERHVGVATEEINLNAYSSTPEQVRKWLESAGQAFEMCGVSGKRREFEKEEITSLHDLRRGVFAKRRIQKGERIEVSNVIFAIPTFEGQITANDMSKYTEFNAETDIESRAPVLSSNTTKIEIRDKVYDIIKQVREFIGMSGVIVPPKVDVEVSHHYGIDRFKDYGLTIFTIVNREYCKKLLILLPGQQHPEQSHDVKEETFHVLYGDVWINLDGEVRKCELGEVVTVDRGVKHSFGTENGAVIEEISSTHHVNDSSYTDPAIMKNKYRKTVLTYWLD